MAKKKRIRVNNRSLDLKTRLRQVELKALTLKEELATVGVVGEVVGKKVQVSHNAVDYFVEETLIERVRNLRVSYAANPLDTLMESPNLEDVATFFS